MKYRKKNIIVDAFKYELKNTVPMWLIKVIANGTVSAYEDGCVINTLEGRMIAKCGDYIIRGVNGEIYPCKADIFAKTYEPVTEEQPELINHPAHYNVPGRKECIDEMEELFSPQMVFGFCIGNEYKYTYRAGYKGDKEQDAKKAVWYQKKAEELSNKYYYPAIKKVTETKTPESVIAMLHDYYCEYTLADVLSDIFDDKDAEIEELKAEVEELKSELDDMKEQICDLMDELAGE